MRVIHSGSGFLGQNSLEVEFRLGAAPFVDELEVHWTCGDVSRYKDLAADRFNCLVEFDPVPHVAPALFTHLAVSGLRDDSRISWRCDRSYAFGRMEARVSRFDVQGRLVRELYRGELPADEHEVYRDGLDGSGKSTASGSHY